MAGECHRCLAQEVIMTSGIWSSYYDSVACGDGGAPTPHTNYFFYRIGIGPAKVKTPMEQPDFKVYKPTKMVSGKLGVQHVI